VCISFNSNSATTYYKCITKKGTTFSQFPCDSHATTYKINTPSNQQTGPKVDYTKQLNELERDRLLAGFQAELRSNNHKLAILDREKQQAEFDQQQRLNRMLDKEDKKRITKDITKKLKAINKKYKKHVAKVKKQIKKLEKKITSYQ
jgi:hypothetical protein